LKKIGGSAITEGEMKKIEKRFSTEKVFSKLEGKKVDWLDYNFKGYPLIATITKLSQLQADVKTTESDIIAGMFQSDLVAAASLTAYQPIVVPEKTAFFQGEAVKGKIILGKFDPNLVAKSVIVNGSSVKAEAGQANFSFGAGAVGEHEITGSFNFDENGKVVSLPIKGNYVVVPKPNRAAVSSDNMQIIYQEVDNPMTISVGGVQNNNVTASALGLTKVGNDGQYKWNVGKFKEKTVSVTVNAKLPDGKVVSDKQTFKVRPVPKPALTLNGDSGLKVGKASELADATLGINFGSFGEGYKISGKVTSVTLTMPGKSPIPISGSPGAVSISDNASAVAALKTLPKGSIVYITATYLQNNGSRKEDAYACSFKIN
jgi:gliding motility-associated protein GldM